MDRRLTPFSGRIALQSLRGQVEAAGFTAGLEARVAVPLADLRAAPGGPRDRQVLMGQALTVIDREGGHAFVRRALDGYCGWIVEAALGPAHAVTHRVVARMSHLYPVPEVKAEAGAPLSFGAEVEVIGEAPGFLRTPAGWLSRHHLRPLSEPLPDPVQAAGVFLGTPYLWGGNSALGVDCSGLVQAALIACGLPCPGDSDQQAQAGGAVAQAALRPGDLVFWKGHVAMVSGPDRIVHATAAVMSTVQEPLSAAIDRIAASGGGPVLGCRRLSGIGAG